MDDAMDSREKARFQHHIDGCQACRGRLEALLALRTQLQALPSPVLGFDLAAQFDDRLRAVPVRSKRPRWRALGWAGAGMTVAVSLALGGWLGGLLVTGSASLPNAAAVRVFDPAPPGGLCAAPELCRLSRGLQ
jgi:anti-sigma factor RsiW